MYIQIEMLCLAHVHPPMPARGSDATHHRAPGIPRCHTTGGPVPIPIPQVPRCSVKLLSENARLFATIPKLISTTYFANSIPKNNINIKIYKNTK